MQAETDFFCGLALKNKANRRDERIKKVTSDFENGKTLRNRLNGRSQTAQKRQRKGRERKKPDGARRAGKDGQFCFKKAEL